MLQVVQDRTTVLAHSSCCAGPFLDCAFDPEGLSWPGLHVLSQGLLVARAPSSPLQLRDASLPVLFPLSCLVVSGQLLAASSFDQPACAPACRPAKWLAPGGSSASSCSSWSQRHCVPLAPPTTNRKMTREGGRRGVSYFLLVLMCPTWPQLAHLRVVPVRTLSPALGEPASPALAF